MIVPALRARALAVRTDLRFDAKPHRPTGPGQLNMRPSACIFQPVATNGAPPWGSLRLG